MDHYVAHVSWMWYRGIFVPRRVAFASIREPIETFVVVPDETTLVQFHFTDVVKNYKVWPREFERDNVLGNEVKVPVLEMEDFFESKKFLNVLFEGKRNVNIETHDVATFMYLELLIPDLVVYVEDQTGDAEWQAKRVAEQMLPWED